MAVLTERLARAERDGRFQSEAVSQTPGLSGGFKKLLGMAQNFIECDREQLLLMSSVAARVAAGEPSGVVRDRRGQGHGSFSVLCALPRGRLGSRGV